MCSATDYRIKSIGGMCILIQMWAWERCTTLAPKRTPPLIENKSLEHRWLRHRNQHIGNDDLRVFRHKLDIMKRHEFLWEPYTANVMSLLPPICLIGSVAWCTVVPLICFQSIETIQNATTNFRCSSQPLNIHGITLKDKHEENWGQLFAPMMVNGYPQPEDLMSFNPDYMIWYRRKNDVEVAKTLQYMVSPQGRNIWTVDDLVPYVEKITILFEEQERINEPVSHGPATEHQLAPQEFHILHSNVETQGIGRRREAVEAKPYLYPQMVEHGHEMYYTPPTFSEYPTQMYQYPFQGHQSDTSTSEHSFRQHDATIATPNAPLGIQWNVPGAIPDMDGLLGVDLRHQFAAEADQVEAETHRGRRNPDKQAQRWEQPCGTFSRHHGHHNE
ncbi:Serine/threonine-protein phosphatase 7 long form [Glycine max]|nr:Serine/threonine-protein phosphatase 7 long form [Glycine max]